MLKIKKKLKTIELERELEWNWNMNKVKGVNKMQNWKKEQEILLVEGLIGTEKRKQKYI